MRRVNINQLKAGMVTAEPVTTRSGQVIIDRGVELTRPLIMRLSFYCVNEIAVTGDGEEAAPAAAKPAPIYSQKIKTSKEFQTFQFDHSFVLNSIKNTMENYVFEGGTLETDEMLRQTTELFDSCKTLRPASRHRKA